MSSCEQDQSGRGLDVVRLQNEHVRVVVLAAAGGKIAELTDLKSGRDWLWKNPAVPFSVGRYGVDYGQELDSGGWDEILMSITPCTLRPSANDKLTIPDHGDLVGQAWRVVRAQTDESGDAVCEMHVDGRAADYLFRRELRLPEGSTRLEIHYSLSNREGFPLPWYWTAHALLTTHRDMNIELPEGLKYQAGSFVAEHARPQGEEGSWPRLDLEGDMSIDLSRSFSLAEQDSFAAKVFVRSPDSGTVNVVIGNTAERLSLFFDKTQLPWLGLWINNGGWSGSASDPYHNLGIEPATTAYDDAAEAINNGALSWIAPGETRRWSLAVELAS